MRKFNFPLMSRKRHYREIESIIDAHEQALLAVKRAYEAERRALAVSTELFPAYKEKL